jgi:hypothetical protein
MRAAILLFLTVILIAPPAVCQSSDDNLIVPGVRIGRWRLGMSIDELVRIHGKGTRTTSFSKGLAPDFDFLHDGLAYAWDADDMEVFTFGRPLAEELEVGVGIKNTRADILRTYGKPTAAAKSYGYARLIYDALGIAVRVENGTGWVRTIAIFKPGSARQIWKF